MGNVDRCRPTMTCASEWVALSGHVDEEERRGSRRDYKQHDKGITEKVHAASSAVAPKELQCGLWISWPPVGGAWIFLVVRSDD
jgi:hypothetical protein